MSEGKVALVNPKRYKDNKISNVLAKRVRGRPRKDVPPELLYKLAQSMLPIESLAVMLGCEPKLIYDRYAHIVHNAREEQKQSLARVMWRKAMDGSERMQIWLSKQHLGYKEQFEPLQGGVNIQINIKDVP